MASSDDFREQLKTGNITEALATALSKAVELKVTTWVASESDEIEATEAKPGHRLRTRLNMIEGKLENEIGDQFIANGRYRELRQFHLDQVAQGNKIIQNNLKSLQKLFEVLAAIRYQAATPSVIEPDSSAIDTPFLPPSEDSAEPPIFQDPSFSSATPVDRLKELDVDDDEDDWDDSVLNLLESLPVTPPPHQNHLDPQFNEDRRNLIEELELPPPSNLVVHRDWATLTQGDFAPTEPSSPPNTKTPNTQSDENLGKLIEEPNLEPPPLDSPANQNLVTHLKEELEPPTVSSDSYSDEDWGDLVEPESQPKPTLANSLIEQDLGTLTPADFNSPTASADSTLEASDSDPDEDWGWGDLIEELEPDSVPPVSPPNQEQQMLFRKEPESPTASPPPNIGATNFSSDEDWGDLVEQEPNLIQDKPVPEIESLNLEDDEDWDNWDVEEPLQTEPTPAREPEILELEEDEDEDWGDLLDDSDPFAMEASKPNPNFIDIEAKTVDTDFNSSRPQTESQEDSDVKAKSVDSKVPPPPPPNRFPSQNNNK